MSEPFIDRIISGFESMRDRPHLDVVARQFAEGEISFIVDRNGIRVAFADDPSDEDPGNLP